MVLRTIKYYGAPHHKPAKPVLRTMNPDPHPRHARACVCVAVGCVAAMWRFDGTLCTWHLARGAL